MTAPLQEPSAPTPGPSLDRLELRIERLDLTFRFTYAFHAREVRFECDRGTGFERVFPETFSFHPERHDPAELFLQLTDLAEKPQLLAPKARQRDCEILISRLLLAVPRYIESVMLRLEGEARLDDARLGRVWADLALLSQILSRFTAERQAGDHPGLRSSAFHLRKLLFVTLDRLVESRVEPDYLARYSAGEADPFDAADDLSETGFFHALDHGEAARVNRVLLRLCERAFFRWVEEVCLDEENNAFEAEGSPFASREEEVRRAICRGEGEVLERGRELTPFLRRPGNRDVIRLLGKLERWFLRQYDIHHAAAMIQHAANVDRGVDDSDQVLSYHRTRTYVVALAAILSPFVGGALFYDSAPRLFDLLCAVQVGFANLLVAWFLFYRFFWRKDLTFFHAAVPRIMAGIIVGYLPIFFIDEVWSLAGRPWPFLLTIVVLLGSTTLLYLYIEVQRRLANTKLAFQRARQIFLLGVLQAGGIGLIFTGLVGRFMTARNWPGAGDGAELESLRISVMPFLGQLPVVVGTEPFFAFPSAVFMMTFMSFFIGTFLQLMWEELPITEPL